MVFITKEHLYTSYLEGVLYDHTQTLVTPFFNSAFFWSRWVISIFRKIVCSPSEGIGLRCLKDSSFLGYNFQKTKTDNSLNYFRVRFPPKTSPSIFQDFLQGISQNANFLGLFQAWNLFSKIRSFFQEFQGHANPDLVKLL